MAATSPESGANRQEFDFPSARPTAIRNVRRTQAPLIILGAAALGLGLALFILGVRSSNYSEMQLRYLWIFVMVWGGGMVAMASRIVPTRVVVHATIDDEGLRFREFSPREQFVRWNAPELRLTFVRMISHGPFVGTPQGWGLVGPSIAVDVDAELAEEILGAARRKGFRVESEPGDVGSGQPRPGWQVIRVYR